MDYSAKFQRNSFNNEKANSGCVLHRVLSTECETNKDTGLLCIVSRQKYVFGAAVHQLVHLYLFLERQSSETELGST